MESLTTGTRGTESKSREVVHSRFLSLYFSLHLSLSLLPIDDAPYFFRRGLSVDPTTGYHSRCAFVSHWYRVHTKKSVYNTCACLCIQIYMYICFGHVQTGGDRIRRDAFQDVSNGVISELFFPPVQQVSFSVEEKSV